MPRLPIPYVMQYGSALAVGASTFVFLSLSTHLLAPSEFSRVSFLFIQLPFYLMCTDLGSHQQFVHRAAQRGDGPDAVDACVLFLVRMAFAAIGLAIACMQGFATRLDASMFLALLVFVASLFSFGCASVLDTLLFARGREGLALSLKVMRIVSVSFALACIAFDWVSTPLGVSIAYVAATLAVCGGQCVWAMRLGVFGEWRGTVWRDAFGSFPGSFSFFMRGTGFSIAVFTSGLFLQSLVVRSFGETRISDWGAAIALSTPHALAVQTLAQMLARPASIAMREKGTWHALKRSYMKRLTLVSAFSAAIYAVAFLSGAAHAAFKHAGEIVLPLTFLLLAQQTLLQLHAPETVRMLVSDKRRTLTFIYLASTIPFAFSLLLRIESFLGFGWLAVCQAGLFAGLLQWCSRQERWPDTNA